MKIRTIKPVPPTDEVKIDSKSKKRVTMEDRLRVPIPMTDWAPSDESSSDRSAAEHHSHDTIAQPLNNDKSPQPDERSAAEQHGGVILIDARIIDNNPYPPRHIHAEDVIDALAKSIADHGQRDPVHVIPHPEKPGRFIISDGWTRVQAIKAYDINDTKVLAKVHLNLSIEDAAWMGYDQNEKRSPHTDLDRALFFAVWIKKGLSLGEISRRTGISKALLSYYGAFDKLPSEAMVLARNNPGKISASVAHLLHRTSEVAGEEKMMRLLGVYLGEDRPRSWLKNELDKLSTPKESAAHTARPRMNFHKKFGVTGLYKQRSDGLVEMRMEVPTDRVDEFNDRVVALMDEFFSSSKKPSGESLVFSG